MDKIQVLFVCLGNICRSPLAEHLFKKHLKQKDIFQYFHVESCGTGGWHQGENADIRTLKNATKNGLNFNHSARQIKPSDEETFHYVLAMDNQNIIDIKKVFNYSKNVFLLSEFSQEFYNKPIPDPYYGNEKDFDEVFHLLNKTTLELANKLEQLYSFK